MAAPNDRNPWRTMTNIPLVSSVMPKTAYVTLWYPKPSETFVVGEVNALKRLGLPIKVYTLYGKLTKHVSKGMGQCPVEVERLGCRSVSECVSALRYWWRTHPMRFRQVARQVLGRRWRDLEQTGENSWAFLSGCRLARLFEADGVRHIHAGWANGPATAAWTAHLLTGIPFSFTGRAGDIYPPDGALREKIAQASFVRTDAGFNVDYLRQFADKKEHIICVRNMLSWDSFEPAPVPMTAPVRLLAVARFVRTKGLDELLKACRMLDLQGVDFRLTLAGSGFLDRSLRTMARDMGIADKVDFPGFILHDHVPELIRRHDIFVMPSKVTATGDRDGVPTVIMESLLNGVPVVATDVGGIREIIRNGETGLLIDQKNPCAMARAIRRLAEDRDAALLMAENGRNLVLDYYDTGSNSRKFLDLIVQNALPA
ncbi:glycosyltransferase [Fundidesulfovibrio butyratiphilus]